MIEVNDKGEAQGGSCLCNKHTIKHIKFEVWEREIYHGEEPWSTMLSLSPDRTTGARHTCRQHAAANSGFT